MPKTDDDLAALLNDPDVQALSPAARAAFAADARASKAKRPLVTMDAADPAPARPKVRSVVEKPTAQPDPIEALLPKAARNPVPPGARRVSAAQKKVDALAGEKTSRRIGTSGKIPTLETVAENIAPGFQEMGNLTYEAGKAALTAGAEAVAAPTRRALAEHDERQASPLDKAAAKSPAARRRVPNYIPPKSVSEHIVEGVEAAIEPYTSTARDLKEEPSRLAPWSPGAGEGAGGFVGGFAANLVDPLGDALMAAPVAAAGVAGKSIAARAAKRAADAARKAGTPAPGPRLDIDELARRVGADHRPLVEQARAGVPGAMEQLTQYANSLERIGNLGIKEIPKSGVSMDLATTAGTGLMKEADRLMNEATRLPGPSVPMAPYAPPKPLPRLSTAVDKAPATIDGYPVNPTPAPKAGGSSLPAAASREDFMATRPKPAPGQEPPTLEGVMKFVPAERRVGAPNRIEILNENPGGRGETPDFKVVVARGENGEPIGALWMALDESGQPDLLSVAVDPAHRRRGVATALYDEAKRAGYDVDKAAGNGGLTDEGAAFTYARQNGKAQPAEAPATKAGGGMLRRLASEERGEFDINKFVPQPKETRPRAIRPDDPDLERDLTRAFDTPANRQAPLLADDLRAMVARGDAEAFARVRAQRDAMAREAGDLGLRASEAANRYGEMDYEAQRALDAYRDAESRVGDLDDQIDAARDAWPQMEDPYKKPLPENDRAAMNVMRGLVTEEDGAFRPEAIGRALRGLFGRDRAPVPVTTGPTTPTPRAPGALEFDGRPVTRAAVDVRDVLLDPQTYQFKASDAAGRTDRFSGEEAWNPDFLTKNPVILHRRADGRLYVADGHQRVNLAAARREAGDNVPPLNALILDEAEGWTPTLVKNKASLINIGEGTGSAIDVARLMRDGGLAPEDIAGLNPKAAIVRDGRALATLDDEAITFVANQGIKPAAAAEAAKATDDPRMRLAILREIADDRPNTAAEAALIARDVLESGLSTGTKQNALFDLADYSKSNRKTLYRIVRELQRSLTGDERMGSYLTARAKEIQRIEGNALNEEANALLKTEAGTLQFMLEREAGAVGPFREALKALASEVDRGKPLSEAVAQARAALETTRGQSVGSGARPGVVPAAPGAPGAQAPAAPTGLPDTDLFGNPVTPAAPPQEGPSLFGDVAQFEAPPAAPEALPVVDAPAPAAPPAASQADRIRAAIERTAADLERARAVGNQDAIERLTQRLGQMQRDYIRAAAEAPADAPAAEVPPPPSRRSQQGRINNLRMREKKAWDAGNQEEAGRLAAEAQLLEDAINPPAERAQRVDPNSVAASRYQNFRKFGGSDGESRVFAEVVQKSVSESGIDPKATVTFEDIRQEAAALDPRLLDGLTKKGLQPGETLHPAVRQAMRDRVKSISGEIAHLQEEIRLGLTHQEPGRVAEIEAMEAQLRRDAQAYIDLLIPARSQDGRNLAFHRMTAAESFAPDYWIAKARRIANGNPTRPLPEPIEAAMRETLTQGDTAKTELKNIVDQLKARGIDTTAIENPRMRVAPALEDGGGVMSGFMNQLKRLFGQETGAWDQAAFDKWMRDAVKARGRRGAISVPAGARRPGSTGPRYVPPALTGDPEIDALLTRGFELAQDVHGARITIAKQLTDLEQTGWLEAVSLFRKAGLLTGLKTIQRNIFGTWTAIGLEEVVKMPASAIDAFMSAAKLTEEAGQRSTMRPRWNEIRASLGEVRGRGVQEFREVMAHGMTVEDLAKVDHAREMNTGFKPLDLYVNKVMRFQSAQDRLGKAYAYTRSIQEQARALSKGDDAARQAMIAKPTDDMARQAIADAEFSTFTNDTVLGDKLVGLARGEKRHGTFGEWGKFIVDNIMPFKKTPAAVAMRVIDYTPAGPVIRIGGMMGDRMKEGLTLPVLRDGRVVRERVRDSRVFAKLNRQEQRIIANSIARGGVGTGLILMGALLAHNAAAVGNYDPARREEDEMSGRQPGSVRLPEVLGGDWAPIGAFSPIGNLIALGASLYESGFSGPGLLMGALGTVLDQPMTQGAQQIIKLANPSEEGLMRDATRVAASQAASYLPTIGSEIAQAWDTQADGYARARDVDTSSLWNATRDSMQNKIPGFLPGPGRNDLPPKVDALGQEVRVPGGISAFGAVAGRPAAEASDPVAQAIIGLGIDLRPVGGSVMDYGKRGRADDVSVRMTPAMEQEYRQMRGAAIHAEVTKVLESPAFAQAAQTQNRDVMRDLVQAAVGKGQSAANKSFRKGNADDIKAGRPAAEEEKRRKAQARARPVAGDEPWWAKPGATVPPGARRIPEASPTP